MSEKFKFIAVRNSQTLNGVIIAISIAGILCGLKSWEGSQTTLTEYCFSPKGRATDKFCNPYQRYVMPKQEFESGKFSPSNPGLQKEVFISGYATKIREVAPTNPHKPVWALAGSTLLAIAWFMNRDATKSLIEVLPRYRSNVQKEWALTELENRYQIQSHAQRYEIELTKQKQIALQPPIQAQSLPEGQSLLIEEGGSTLQDIEKQVVGFYE